MDDRVIRLEARVEELSQALDEVRSRLAALEGTDRGPAAQVAAATSTSTPAGAVPAAPGPWAAAVFDEADPADTIRQTASAVLPLAGRSFLIFGGAWLLRALTDAGTLPRGAGVAVGLVYAVLWLVLADRAGAARRTLSAEFLGVTSAIIAYPIVWEATTRLHVLSVPAAAAALAVLATAGLVTAWRRTLHALAWAVTLAALSTAFVLLVATHAMALFAGFLVALGITAVWITYERHWFGLRWVTAGVADLVVLEMVSLGSQPGGPPETYATLSVPAVETVAVGLLVGYLATIAVRTLVRRRDVNVFESLQTVAALVVGFGGAVAVARTAGSGTGTLGAAALVTAAACYAVAFAFVDRRLGRGVNFVFYTSLALVFTVSGSLLVAAGGVLAGIWCALALAAAALGGRFDRVTLRAHSVTYILAAGLATGLVAGATRIFVTPVSHPWGPFAGPGWLVLGAAVACYAVLAAGRFRNAQPWSSRLPHLLAAVLAAVGVGGLLVLTVMHLAAGRESWSDPAVLATVRTVVLSGTAVLVAALGRRSGLAELAWLAYPLLVLGGIKLVAQDLPQGRPATLVIGFAAYGIALILTPRLLRRQGPA